jgi:hypothetical protein
VKPTNAFDVLALALVACALCSACSSTSATPAMDSGTTDGADAGSVVRGPASDGGSSSSSSGSSSGATSGSSSSGASSGSSSSGSSSGTSSGSSSGTSSGGATDGGEDASSVDPTCAAQASYNACLACCQQGYPTALAVLATATTACDCGPNGQCQTSCATEFCQNQTANPGDACYTCLANSLVADAGVCFGQVNTACNSDPGCAAYNACSLPCNLLP